VIQPYIGLQFGLVACREKLLAGDTNVLADIEMLLHLSTDGITDLRGYIRGLRLPGARAGTLLPAMRRFVDRFASVTGIAVHIDAPPELHISDRLAAEVLQMIAEGLSNIRRHTQAAQAIVVLGQANGHLHLRIENDADPTVGATRFTPRSLTERAAALGGYTSVESWKDQTVIRVDIPL
jgi:signal transduction histidine kinase